MQAKEPVVARLKPIELPAILPKPLVSVLISNFNYGQYLEEAVESVCTQSYPKLEILLCDDGSTDNSWKIIERLHRRNLRIKAFRQPNSGQAAALNRAFEESSGEIICFLDADDTFRPQKIERLVAAFLSSPDSGLAIHRMLRVDASRRILGAIPLLYHLPHGWQGKQFMLDGPQMLPGLPPCSGISLHRAVATRLFPLPEGLKAYADTLVQVIAPMLTPVIALDEILGEYRVHGRNVAGKGRFSAGDVEKLLSYENEIWHSWRVHAECLLGGSRSSNPYSFTKPLSVLDYANARFHREPTYRKIYHEVARTSGFLSLPAPHRWGWIASRYLPSRAFCWYFGFVYGQSFAKNMVGHIVQLCHALQSRLRLLSPTPSEVVKNRGELEQREIPQERVPERLRRHSRARQ